MPNLHCTCLVCTYGINYDNTQNLNILLKREEHIYNINWFNLVGDYEINPIPVPIIRTRALNPIIIPPLNILEFMIYLLILLIMLFILEYLFHFILESVIDLQSI
jgi:hypothetical protein